MIKNNVQKTLLSEFQFREYIAKNCVHKKAVELNLCKGNTQCKEDCCGYINKCCTLANCPMDYDGSLKYFVIVDNKRMNLKEALNTLNNYLMDYPDDHK